MIYFEAPYQVIEGLTILKDHRDPLQYYYFPLAPRLALQPDGSPAFLFVKYKKDLSLPLPNGSEAGGGFLNFDVDLRVDQDSLDTARREIKKRFHLDQEPLLAPLDYRSGKTKLIFLDFAPPPDDPPSPPDRPVTPGPATPPPDKFVERASYFATPSLYGDNRAAFSVQLTPWGATLVEDTLDMQSSMIAVVFDLSFVGLRPAYRVRLHIDWDRVSSFIENEFKASFLVASADIDTAVDKLIEQRVIDFEVVSFGAGATDADIIADKDQAVQFVKGFITEKFFEPSMNPHEARSENWASQIGELRESLKPSFCGYTHRDFTKIDHKTLSITLEEKSAIERRIVPQGHLQGLMTTLKDSPREAYIREVNLADPFFQTVKITAETGAAILTDKLDHVQVHLEYGPLDAPQPQDLILDTSGAAQVVQWSLIPSVGLSYRYHYELFFKPEAPAGKSAHLVSPIMTTNSTKLVIDPRDLYKLLQVHVETVNFPFALYPQVEVELRYEDPDNDLVLTNTILLSDKNPRADWSVRLSNPDKIGYKYRITVFPAGGGSIPGQWVETINPAVLVENLSKDISVSIFPAGNWDKIQRILVTMAYQDPDHNVSQSDMITLASASDTKVWTIHAADPTRRTYEYRVVVQYKDGSIKPLAAQRSSDTLLFVGDVFRRTEKVMVMAAGRSFEDANLAKIRVRLSYDDDANQIHTSKDVVLMSLADKADWSFDILDAERDSYNYEITYFATNGFQRKSPAQTSNNDHLVVPI